MLDLGRRLWLWTALAWLGAAALAVVLTLPAVWWEPLHGDEIVTLRFARQSPEEILDHIFVNRGGAPLHFLIERVTLTWPDGLAGLRIPSVVFFVLALPAAGLVAGRLVDRRAALILPFALACAPLAVGLGTFGRMYSLFLAATLWATVLALWAARRDRWWAWTLAGIAAGLLVYVHPVAPLYSALVVATGLVCAAVPLRRLLRIAWTAPVALALAQAPYYAVALGVLRDRYEVELGAPRAQAIRAAGRSVPEQSLIGLGPGELAGSFFALALALIGLAWLAADRPRPAIALALWGVLPIAFFTFVPTGTTFFFPRYLLPALPFFLLLVVCGCLAFFVFGRIGAFAAGALLAGLLVWQIYDVGNSLDRLRHIRMRALVSISAKQQEPAVLFAAVGNTPFGGRLPRYFDEYVLLETTRIKPAPENEPEQLAAFVRSHAEPAVGVLIFAGQPSTMAAARTRFERHGAEIVPISPSIFIVRSSRALEPRELVELAAELREIWLEAAPDDREARELLDRERYALGAS